MYLNHVSLTTSILFCITACAINPAERDSLDNLKYKIETSIEFASSVRAIDVVDDSIIAFTGYGGFIGITTSGGTTWDTTRVSVDDRNPAFRACAVVGDNLIMASIESPGLILKAPLKDLSNPTLTYVDNASDVFLDAMAFSSKGFGVVMGDPTEGCLTIIMSYDNGDSWSRVPCNKLPKTIKGEAAFAASNGNISIVEDQIWIATGGKVSRVFHSQDRGANWAVYPTPLIQGGAMTGAFAISFHSNNEGLLIGGDWEDKESNKGNIAHTFDGGKTWQLVSEGAGPGYRSSIIWRPHSDGECVAIGSEGIDISNDYGASWNNISEQGFYTGRFTPNGKVLWLAGHGVVSKIKFE
jgi:photosystem II stability/assembly factor-like uncharacterized protein